MSRLLKVLTLAVLLATSAALAADVRPVSEPRAGDVLAEFAWRFPGEPILAKVKVDDREHLFVVDTGATYCVLDSSLREKLGRVRRVQRTVIGKTTRALRAYRLKARLSVSGVPVPGDSDVLCLDLEQVRQVTGLEIRGILGMQFLRNHVLRLEFDRRKAQLLPAGVRPGRDWGRQLSLREGDLLLCPYVMVFVGGAGARPFLVDTGARGIGMVARAAFEGAARGKKVETVTATALGAERSRSARGSAISIGGFGVPNPVLTEGEQNITGLEMLSRFTVTLDFPRGKIYLAPGQRFGAVDPGYPSGLRLMKDGGRVLVHSVLDNSSAAKAGVERGDRLLECNGRRAEAWALAELRALGAEGKVGEMTLKLRRGKRDLEKKLVLRDLIPPLPLPALHAAVLAGDLRALRAALDAGARPDEAGDARVSALHLAVALGRRRAADLLLKRGAAIGARDGRRFTALHLAAANGDLKMMSLLLKRDAGVNVETAAGWTPLHFAAAGRFASAAGLLLKRRAILVDVRDRVRATPMLYACASGSAEVVRLLLGAGADVKARGRGGGSLLQAAASNGRIEVISLLLDAGLSIETVNDAGATALHWAASHGHTGAVELLLQKGAKVDALTSVGTTPLHAAAHTGQTGAARRLLKAGADIGAANKRGETPIHFAAVFGQQETLEFLLASGAGVNARSKAGMTPLLFSLRDGHDEMALYLIARGADVKARAYGTTVMHAAAGSGCVGTVRKLIAGGFGLEVRDGAGNTPLQTAVWMQQKEVAALLLEKGAATSKTVPAAGRWTLPGIERTGASRRCSSSTVPGNATSCSGRTSRPLETACWSRRAVEQSSSRSTWLTTST